MKNSEKNNQLKQIINNHMDCFLGSIDDVFNLHIDIGWALNVLANDNEDNDHYKYLLQMNVQLTQIEREYMIMLEENKKEQEAETSMAINQ